VTLLETISEWSKTLAAYPVKLKLAGLALRCGQNM
jgi:hypothetical protein